MIRKYLKKIVSKHDLTQEESYELFDQIMSGKATEGQIGALIGALSTKGEAFTELAGASTAMRRKAVRVNVNSKTVVDTCGTGGDSLNTFNISTTAAFVVAGCGITVAKHGNRSVSSKCGSADLLEELGVKINIYPEIVEEAINDIGIGFLFAPVYHGALKYASKVRKEVGIRSIFNMLGPLCNPAGANCQLLGVYAPHLTQMFAETLKTLGTRRALVVCGHDGLDEISICSPTRVTELNDGIIKTYDLYPEDLVEQKADIGSLKGGSVKENARITWDVLSGEKGPKRDIVLVNAAGAILSAGAVENLKDAVKLAGESIDSGNAMNKLKELILFTNKNQQII